MRRLAGILTLASSALLAASSAVAGPSRQLQELVPAELEADIAAPYRTLRVGKVQADTIWIADWTFDEGGCNSTGWTMIDNRILNDGSNYWSTTNQYSALGAPGMSGKQAKLGYHDLCTWPQDGYGNNWDYAIKVKYTGSGLTLRFRYLLDSEAGYDFLRVEADSAGASEARYDPVTGPSTQPSDYRQLLRADDGTNYPGPGATISVGLPDYARPTMQHAVWIRYVSDAGESHAFGIQVLGAGLVVDSLQIKNGANVVVDEEFEGPIPNATTSFVNAAPNKPFGQWARLYQHITDNDKCDEDYTCAWLWSDPALVATNSSTAFGPGSAVVRKWLDNIIMSPWTSLATSSNSNLSVLSFRRFGGNNFQTSRIVQNWSVRAKSRIENADTTAGGDSIECISPWGHDFGWTSVSSFSWLTNIFDMTPFIANVVAPGHARDLQVRFRVSDWQYIAGSTPCQACNVGPGPYIDRVRIGRLTLHGPVISEGSDSRSQAQDAFATVENAIPHGHHYSPDPDPVNGRFGSCAFSQGTELTINKTGPNIVTGDSIHVQVSDAREAGGVSAVQLYASIVSGPHAGRAPAPYSVGANAFFAVNADSCRTGGAGTLVADQYFVDFDDDYFRGGDLLQYFWYATDHGGGVASDPAGITSNPATASRDVLEGESGGLLEVDYLPTINWDPSYVTACQTAANGGKVTPTATQIANSTQSNCVLYVQLVNTRRRSGLANRTSFMYTLDNLGYRGHYDVYDLQGLGNTNNQIGSRATTAQAKGYALIIYDAGRQATFTMPNHENLDDSKVAQADWYHTWLSNGSTNIAGQATLWVIGENCLQEKSSLTLYTSDMGVSLAAADQALAANPNVSGAADFQFVTAGTPTGFASDLFALNGGCPSIRTYDGLNAVGGSSVITHRYTAGTNVGPAAMVMNKNIAAKYNTILSSFGWFDIRDPGQPPTPQDPPAENVLLGKLLSGVLPPGCQQGSNPTSTAATPRVTQLFQNVPNPFNPMTTIRFDLAHEGHVQLRIFDVSGRVVRTLLDAELAGGSHPVIWNGLDVAGHRARSGVYLYRLVTDDYQSTRKMLVLK